MIFLAGLKFALGLAVVLTLLSGVAMIGMISAELLDRWRKKHRRLHWEAKARALRRAMPQFRQRVVFRFHFCADDWLSIREKNERLPREF